MTTTDPKKKPTAREIWSKLVEEAGEDAVERAASMSDEEVVKELVEAGFDVEAEKAKAEEFLEQLRQGKLDVGAEDSREEGPAASRKSPR